MRRPIADLGAFGRALGFVAVAAIVVLIAVHFRHSDDAEHAPPPAPSTPGDPLARELVRCQGLGMAAEDDVGCKAAWAENRRRFFASPPADVELVAGPTTEKAEQTTQAAGSRMADRRWAAQGSSTISLGSLPSISIPGFAASSRATSAGSPA